MKKVFKKFVTMGLAAIMAVSAMSISAFAARVNENGEVIYGTVDTLEELMAGLETDDYGIEPFGSKNPPSNIAGSNTQKYWFGSSMPIDKNEHLNEAATFEFEFSSSCKLTTTQYAEFLAGVNQPGGGLKLTGNSCTGNVSVSLVHLNSGSAKGPKELFANRSISFVPLTENRLYAIKLTPVVAGKAIEGEITVDIS